MGGKVTDTVKDQYKGNSNRERRPRLCTFANRSFDDTAREIFNAGDQGRPAAYLSVGLMTHGNDRLPRQHGDASFVSLHKAIHAISHSMQGEEYARRKQWIQHEVSLSLPRDVAV